MRESDNGHICAKCGETVFHDQCGCMEALDPLGPCPICGAGGTCGCLRDEEWPDEQIWLPDGSSYTTERITASLATRRRRSQQNARREQYGEG
jgi:hypothetical protein